MDMEQLKKQIEDEDFVIRLRPYADDDGKWSGEIDISIMAFPENQMDDDDYGQVMHFCKMMCATVPLMESDEQLRDTVHSYVLEVVDNEPEDMIEQDDQDITITHEDGNVVRLNFNSKTGGNA